MNSLRDRDTDRESDLSDYRQPRDYGRDRPDRYREQGRDRDRDQDREISLGTGTILGIFFALALLCAVFFGFGYSMGRKSAQPTVAIADALPSTGLFGGTKPSPGNPVRSSQKISAPVAASPAIDEASELQPTPPDSASEESNATKQTPAAVREKPTKAPLEPPTTVAARPATKPLPASSLAADTPMPAINPNGTLVVQIAAVSHQEDADLLVSALKNRGYTVFTRQEVQDHLLHVQVGPFATRKDAEGMLQRIKADGYNAIIK